MAVAPEPTCGGSLSSVTASSGARSPFLLAGLVYSVVLGLDLRAGLVQVLQLPLLGGLAPTLEVEHGDELAHDNLNS